MAVTHAKVSAKADGADTTLVRPIDWNAGHVIPDAEIARAKLAADAKSWEFIGVTTLGAAGSTLDIVPAKSYKWFELHFHLDVQISANILSFEMQLNGSPVELQSGYVQEGISAATTQTSTANSDIIDTSIAGGIMMEGIMWVHNPSDTDQKFWFGQAIILDDAYTVAPLRTVEFGGALALSSGTLSWPNLLRIQGSQNLNVGSKLICWGRQDD